MVENRQYEAAVEALHTLMRQSAYAKDADCNKWLGQSLCSTGHYQEAVRPLELAIKQNRRSGAQWYMAITRQHLYDFEGAIEAIEAYRPVLKSDLWIERADSLEAECQQGLRALNHTEDVVIIDSLSVDQKSFFQCYNLGPESGRILSDSEQGLFFENQSADYRLFANGGSFFESYKIQDMWEEKSEIAGIHFEDYQLAYPFMRSDGETLYFACDSTPGLGGMDIYKTKYNSEEKSFYAPERLGMPFNSPFNDYMLAIDETHQVGWWATDRNAAADSLTIYLFKIADDPDYLDEPSVSRARIDAIAETWQDPHGYADLVADIMNQSTQQKADKPRVSIIVDEQHLYTNPDQFTSNEARTVYLEYEQQQVQYAEAELELVSLRSQYAEAGRSSKEVLKSRILQLENSLQEKVEEMHLLAKKYRAIEVAHLNQ